MFALAFGLGTFSYIIFFLGIFGLLYKPLLIPLTLLGIAGLVWLLSIKYRKGSVIPNQRIDKFFLALLLLQVLINAIGALGPELGFDALWYHGTLPKIYLANHQILHISNNLFYYSDMPKLIEMLYTAVLSFGNDLGPKLVHFGLGLACCAALFGFSRKFLSKTLSLAVVLVFYSNLVVGWESISGYIDLGRTLFEILALYAFVEWSEKQEVFWLIISACMTGFAITSKFLAFGSLGIFLILIVMHSIFRKRSFLQTLKHLALFSAISIAIPLPWMIFSFVHTGNPVYPFFSSAYPIAPAGSILNLHIFSDLWNLFTASADPISPVYLAFLPLVLWYIKKASGAVKLIYVYSFLALIVWYLTPRTGGGRFILPYLSAFSFLAVFPLQFVTKKLTLLFYGFIVIVSVISLAYRGTANAKFIPVILGKETTGQFLTTHLNFSFGDFYDTDGFFAKRITSHDLVLLEGFHNLYYADFPYTFDQDNKHITYVALQGQKTPPKQFAHWKLVHTNPITHVLVYEK